MSSDKEDDLSFQLPESKWGIIMVFVVVILGIILLWVWMIHSENANKARFEALCHTPRGVEGLNCFDLQEAIWVCPEALDYFIEINCTIANRTMRVVGYD